jgi:hypothetical protein
MRTEHTRAGARRRVAKGSRPVSGLAHGRGARPHGSCGGFTVRAGPSRVGRDIRTPEPADGDAWRRGLGRCRAPECEGTSAGARHQFLFHLALFRIVKLQILEHNSKIPKYKSCRETIGLQLSQRVTYVLVNRLTGKT